MHDASTYFDKRNNYRMQWAYGITCWEVFTGGQSPYAAIKPSSILGLLQQGERLEIPNNSACSNDM